MLAPEELEHAVRRVPSPTPWVEADKERLVLTGNAESLRAFLRDHLRQPGALDEPERFVRVRAP
jgi:hypothetical protein